MPPKELKYHVTYFVSSKTVCERSVRIRPGKISRLKDILRNVFSDEEEGKIRIAEKRLPDPDNGPFTFWPGPKEPNISTARYQSRK